MKINKKKLLFQLNHPAHYHLFKNTIDILLEKGHDVLISIKDKDILKELVSDYQYVQLSTGYRKKQFFSIIKSVIERDRKLYKLVKEYKPDILLGTSPEIAHISHFVKVPAIFFGEDDINLSASMLMGALSCYPLFDTILAPNGVKNGVWNNKTIRYNGFQKLAYLHPNYFHPSRDKVNIPINDKYFILRFSNLQAYHDTNATGITDSLAQQIVDILSPHGKVIISSERKLPVKLQKYIFTGNISDMHHYLAFANLFIGDSQSMAVESAMLGTPNIRYSNFVGKITVLEEIESKYKLSIGVNSNNPQGLLLEIDKCLSSEFLDIYNRRREFMLNDKIDVTSFFVWFIENYPKSKQVMINNPNFQNKFKKHDKNINNNRSTSANN